jgi:hypothetical protein
MVPRFRWSGAEPKEAQMDHGNNRESWVALIISVGIIVVIAALVFWGVVGGR